MLKRFLLITCLTIPGLFAWSQVTRPDSSSVSKDSMTLSVDADVDIDELFDDLDLFLDSLLAPRSYTLLSLGAGAGYFNYVVRTPLRGASIKQVKKVIWSPTVGYYDKGGLGITLSSNVIHDTAQFRAYQWLISPSYAYLKNKKPCNWIFAHTLYHQKKNPLLYITAGK